MSHSLLGGGGIDDFTSILVSVPTVCLRGEGGVDYFTGILESVPTVCFGGGGIDYFTR